MKRQPSEWEKIFANDLSDKELVSKIYKELIKLNTQNTNNAVKKWAKDMNRRLKETHRWPDIQMANRHMKRWSLSLIIREIQIKIAMRYHLTPVRMASIKKIGNNKCWQRCGEKGILMRYWWECKLVQLVWKTVWRFLKKLKVELPYDPVIILLGIFPKKMKTLR